VDEVIKSSIPWDVMCGVARRAWARNPHSMQTAAEYNIANPGKDHLTLPFLADEHWLQSLVEKKLSQ